MIWIVKKSNSRSYNSKRAPTNFALFTFSKDKLLYLHSTRAWFSLCFESKEWFLEVPFDHHRLSNPICNQQDFQQHSLSYLLLWFFCLWHLSHIFLKKIENNHLNFETTFLSNCNYTSSYLTVISYFCKVYQKRIQYKLHTGYIRTCSSYFSTFLSSNL